ncbi:MAG: TolC family protein [Tepidisphaeraceae bacterium]
MISLRKPKALALAALAWLCGCTPMPTIEPVDQQAASLTAIGAPFVFQTEREPTDVAESRSLPDGLSMDAAVRLALQHDPSLQASLARVRQAEAQAKQARLLPNPILSVLLKFPDGGGKPDIEAAVAADLLSLITQPGRISAADQRLRKATAESLTVVLDVIHDVQSQYTQAQAFTARSKIVDARRQILSDLLRVTESRVRAGEAGRLDVLTVQSEVSALEIERLRLSSEARQARLRLARRLGRPSGKATWTLDDWANPRLPSTTEQALVAASLQMRPELQSTRWELAALGDDLRVAGVEPFIDGGAAGAAAERQEAWAVGPSASVPVPLFDVGQARRSLITAQIIEQRHELTRRERQIVEEVRVAMEAFRSARAALAEVENTLIPLQRDRLKQAESAYEAGLADVLAVRLAEQDLQRGLSQQVELQSELCLAQFQLARAVGGTGVLIRAVEPPIAATPSQSKD